MLAHIGTYKGPFLLYIHVNNLNTNIYIYLFIYIRILVLIIDELALVCGDPLIVYDESRIVSIWLLADHTVQVPITSVK